MVEQMVEKLIEGTKYDTGKLRLELDSPEATRGRCEVLTYGANKYEDRNWEKGILYSRVLGALKRHLLAFEFGEDLDTGPGGSGKRHIDHAACCIMFLQTYTARGMKEFDDLPGRMQTNFPLFVVPESVYRSVEDTGFSLKEHAPKLDPNYEKKKHSEDWTKKSEATAFAFGTKQTNDVMPEPFYSHGTGGEW